MLIATLTLLLVLVVICGVLYHVFSIICVMRFFCKRPGGSETPVALPQYPPVSIVKPIKGLDPNGSPNLSSFCRQDYPCYEVLFGFLGGDDPALPLARSIVDSSEGRARLILSESREPVPNQKVLNVEEITRSSRYPLLAISDSDMSVRPGYLKTIVEEYERSGKTGMVTCLYKISAPLSLGSALESLVIGLDFIPSVLVASRLEGVTFGLGASMLLSKQAISDIGGLRPIADYLADDYQLGYRLWRKGYKNVISRYVMENRVGRMGINDHVHHQIRWLRTYRVSRPKGFLGYGITHSLVASLLLFAVAPTWWSLAAVSLVIMIRCALAFTVCRGILHETAWLKWLFLLPFKDALSFVLWLVALMGSTVQWRDNRYRVLRGGKMVRI
jgi:ceramide glucosyltransferase